MKKILLSLAAVAALGAAAAPAAAQPWRGDYGGYEHRGGGRLTTSYVDGLEWKINNAARSGRISWGEARELRREFREVQPLAWRVETGAARPWEVQRLDRTVSRIEQAVNDRGWRRYGYGYGERSDWRR